MGMNMISKVRLDGHRPSKTTWSIYVRSPELSFRECRGVESGKSLGKIEKDLKISCTAVKDHDTKIDWDT